MAIQKIDIDSKSTGQKQKDTKTMEACRVEENMPTKVERRVAGGAATGGGINFQAAVSAIAYVYMVRGQQLSWLEKMTDDVPVAVEAETGGAGDDIRLLIKSGEIVEVQVKKGLRSGNELWDSLTKLATAHHDGTIDYGVLIVSPTSSNTISYDLAGDIVRLGDGRTDNLSNIAQKWVEKLKEQGLPIIESCKCIRIQTINALAGNQSSVLAARSEIAHLCIDQQQTNTAWNVLYKDALALIEQRGRRDVSSVLRLLRSEGVGLANNNSTAPMLVLEKLTSWMLATYASFSIFGIKKSLRIDEAWIPLSAVVENEAETEIGSLAEALEKYQLLPERSVHAGAEIVNPETLGRFVMRAILIGGPGMGKTTLLKRIARRYSEDSIPVLYVKLTTVVSRMRAGSSFEEAVFDLGLDGSGITSVEARQSAFSNWLLLCDGLDECGKLQEEVAAGVARFAAGNQGCRVLVATRPVGYETAYFSDWKHYSIAPLETYSTHAYLATLVAECMPEESTARDKVKALCGSELEQDQTKKIVARSPLMLGLAASIIVRGGHLSTSKERLFEQIFELIDEVPNSRIPAPPASSAVLQRYLDILGWHITAHPLDRIDQTLNFCAEELARETEVKFLKARGEAEACLRYWLDVGMIEKIGHGSEKTLAFIHKSFGEFAAARYLRFTDSEKQRALITDMIDSPEWEEVIRYASMLGLSNVVAGILIPSEAFHPTKFKRLLLSVELAAMATSPPNRELRTKIFKEVFEVVSSARRVQAYNVCEPLVAAARRFPEEVGPLAADLLDHDHPWTNCIAWATSVAAGPSYYRLEKLADALSVVANTVQPVIKSSLGKGVIFERNVGREVVQAFVLDAAAELLERCASEQGDSIVFKALNARNLSTVDFLEKAQNLLRTKGRVREAVKLGDQYNHRPIVPIEGYAEAQFIAYEAIFDSLDLPEQVAEQDKHPGVLLHFSAFLQSSNFWNVPVSDTWAWSLPFNKVATRETLKGFIGVSGVDIDTLRSEAEKARVYLHSVGEAEAHRIFDLTTKVDPPEINWDMAPSLGLDIERLEAALFHPSRWIVWLSGNLIGNLLPPQELEMVLSRLFENGEGHTLWAASALAAELEQEKATQILLERLSKPLVSGCEYLYEALLGLELEWGEELSEILRLGLKGEADTAVAAAKLVADIAKPGRVDLANILVDAFEYWVENEEPYPIEDGVVPPSPRAQLVKTLLKVKPPSYTELKRYTIDPRSDVKDIGESNLIDFLKLSDGSREQFLNDICSGELAPHLLEKAIKVMAPLSSEKREKWALLMTVKNAKLRYSAMSLLHEDYLDKARIRNLARIMTEDEEQQIRDRAYRILDLL